MSGPKGVNDWEKYWKPNRVFLQRLDEQMQRSRRVRLLSNADLAQDLYKMLDSGEMDEFAICEAAERLSVAILLTKTKPGNN